MRREDDIFKIFTCKQVTKLEYDIKKILQILTINAYYVELINLSGIKKDWVDIIIKRYGFASTISTTRKELRYCLNNKERLEDLIIPNFIGYYEWLAKSSKKDYEKYVGEYNLLKSRRIKDE